MYYLMHLYYIEGHKPYTVFENSKNVWYNIATEPSYVYKIMKNAKNG